MAPALVSSQAHREWSLALSHPDRLMNTQDEGQPPPLPGFLLYFGTLKMLSVAKGLLQLCAQSHGSFPCVSSGDVPAAAKQTDFCLQ